MRIRVVSFVCYVFVTSLVRIKKHASHLAVLLWLSCGTLTAFGQLVYQGLTNTALGQADIYEPDTSLGTSSFSLIVTNLGSGGLDGVAIALPGGLTGLTVQWQDLDDSNTLPVGAYVEEQMVGTADGITNAELGSLTMTKAGSSNYEVSADFSEVGASTYTVQAYYQGVLGLSVRGQNGPNLATAGGWPQKLDWQTNDEGSATLSVHWLLGTTVRLTGANVTSDELLITPENVTSGIGTTAIQFTASQVPAITIIGENVSLVYQGLTNMSLGDSVLYVTNLGSGGQDGVTLIVTNLGSGGQDGVAFAMAANITALNVSWQPTNGWGSLPAGAYIEEQEKGFGNDLLGTVTTTFQSPTNFMIAADFSPIGASAYAMQVYYQGVLVGQSTNQGGTNAPGIAVSDQAQPNEKKSKKAKVSISNNSQGTSYVWSIGEPSDAEAFVMLNGTAMQFDEIDITPLNATFAGPPASFQMTASQVPGIAITSENVSLVYQGLTNTSLGSAAIAVSCCISNLGSGGQDGLSVSDPPITNLGSGGQDGLAFAIPSGGKGLSVQWQDLDDANTLPVGAYLQSQALGTANGITNGELGTLTVTKAGTSNYVISADYSAAGASTYTVQAYYQGVLQLNVKGQDGPNLASVNVFPKGKDIGDKTLPLSEEWPGQQNVMVTMGGGAGGGGTSVPCDHLIVSPENVTYALDPTVLQIVESQIPSLTITSENVGLVYQGLTNTSLGSAVIVESCCISNLGSGGQDGVALIVTNLGSGGQDGLGFASADASGQQSLSAAWAPLDPSNLLATGAQLIVNAIGSSGTITNGILGSAQVTKTSPTNFSITADFPSAGTNTVSVRAYNGSVLVAKVDGLSGTLCTAPEPPTGTENGTGPYNPFPPYDYIGGGPIMQMTWTAPLLITISGGSQVMADAFVAIPDRPGPNRLLSTVQLLASDIPQIVIAGESATASFGGMAHTSLGSAMLMSEPITNLGSAGQDGVTLIVTNLGSGGQDGMAIAFPGNLTDWSAQWLDPDAAGFLPVGAYLQESVIGSSGTVSNALLAELTTTKMSSSNYLMAVDLSPMGVSNYTVVVYDGPNVTGQVSGVSNGIALALQDITLSVHIYFHPFRIVPDGQIGPVTIDPDGAALAVTGDHYAIIPQGVTAVPSALHLQASGVPGLAITNEAVGPVVLGATAVNQSLSFQWFGTGTLQQCPDLKSWADVTNSTSPFVAPTGSEKQGYYRIRQPAGD